MTTLEQRVGVWVVVGERGCRPASLLEVELWERLARVRAALNDTRKTMVNRAAVLALLDREGA